MSTSRTSKEAWIFQDYKATRRRRHRSRSRWCIRRCLQRINANLKLGHLVGLGGLAILNLCDMVGLESFKQHYLAGHVFVLSFEHHDLVGLEVNLGVDHIVSGNCSLDQGETLESIGKGAEQRSFARLAAAGAGFGRQVLVPGDASWCWIWSRTQTWWWQDATSFANWCWRRWRRCGP